MDLSLLEKNLGYKFKNKDLLYEAVTHRSFLNENRNWKYPHNERLEFLGDAVLELIITEYLFRTFALGEGILTSYRAALVNAQSLAETASQLQLGDFLLLSRGEAKEKNNKGRQEILGNAFEAVVGAVYLDGGYEQAASFINRVLLPRLAQVIEQRLFKDPKSLFQEEAQARVNITPSYQVLDEWGPDHDKRFLVAVYLGSEEVGRGEGGSKQEAEIAAAQKALEKKGWGR